ncbi:MAG: hypothetical protein KF801_02785 [Cryobacterium sp.]|jgi:hypothetical protein|nr:hypothetical protein [Cryobacterium sp.]
MPSTRKRILVPAAIVLSLTLAPMLTACGNPIQGLVNQVTGGGVDLGGASLPKDFPKEVPLASGSVIFGAGLGNDDGKVWNVTIKVSDGKAMDGIAKQLTDAGFESVASGDASNESTTGAFSKDPYGVIVVVTSDDKGGFVANYTVTYTKPGS